MYIFKRREKAPLPVEFHKSDVSLLPVWVHWPKNTLRVLWRWMRFFLLHDDGRKVGKEATSQVVGGLTGTLIIIIFVPFAREMVIDHWKVIPLLLLPFAALTALFKGGSKKKRRGKAGKKDEVTNITYHRRSDYRHR